MRQKHAKQSRPNPTAKRPQAIPSSHEFEQLERGARLRAREDLLTRIHQFVRVDIPPRLRGNPWIHNVGQIEGEGGRVLTLIRCDVSPGARADERLEAPSIALMQMTNELTVEFVAVLTPQAAEAAAFVLRPGRPQGTDPAGLGESALATTEVFQGWSAGAVVIACPPQRVTAHAHLVGFVNTFDDDKILLIRGVDGGVSITFQPDFTAHLSLPATEALAQVLEEFAQVHHVEGG